jgi:AbrB family looped-hinge helix DNA binding protein
MNEIAVSTVTSKGQITIPKAIRDHLRLRPGHRVEFEIDPKGLVVMRGRNGDVRALKGIVRSKRKRPVSVAEMNGAIARGWSGT